MPEFEPYPYTQLYNWGTSAYQSLQYDIPGGGLVSPMRFRLMTPNGFNRAAVDGKKYPLIVFLHGSGESAPYDAAPDNGSDTQDNERQLVHGGERHKNAVLNNTFPGLLLYPQIRNPNPALGIGPSWGFDGLGAVERIILKLIEGYKVDPDRIYIHGLSMGGEGTWRFISWKPLLFAAAHPMSAAGTEFWKNPSAPAGYWTGEARQRYKHIPLRLSQGALDTGPAPFEGNGIVTAVREIGASIRYAYYPTLGHGTWDSEYAKADFFPWLLSKRKNQITVFGEQTSFCPGENFSVVLGLTPGFANYQWAKDTTQAPFASGAAVNEITVTQAESASSGAGTYYARFQRSNGAWTYWSKPVTIDRNRGLSTTPSISSNGQSVNLPSLEGSPEVILYGTASKAAYAWAKDGVALPNTTQSITVSTPGAYTVQTRDPAQTGFAADGVTPTEFRATAVGCLSPASTPLVVTTQNGLGVPAPPTNFFASATSTTTVIVSWDDRSADELGFELYRSTTAGAGYKLVKIIAPTSSSNPQSYTDTNLTPNTAYFYRMRAVNNSGGSAYTPEVSVTTSIDNIPPTAPVLTVGATSRTEINLSWSGATDNVGIFEYDVYQNDVLIATLTGTSYKATGLVAFNTYRYIVKARDLSGNVSPPSNQVNPAAVNTGLFYSYYHHDATLSSVNQILTKGTLIKTGYIAQFVLGQQTRGDGFAFIYEGYINIPTTGSYTFYTSSDDGSQLFVNNVLVVNNDGTHGCSEKTGTPISLSAGTYPIRALMFEDGGGECMNVKWQGPGISKADVPASALKDNFTPPNALTTPNSFEVDAVSPSQINVTWNDRSNNETGFEISRSLTSGGTYQVVNVTAANAESWSNTGLAPSTRYYYKIRAINATSASSLVGPENDQTSALLNAPTAPSGLNATASSATQVNLTWNDNSSNESGFEIQRSSANVSASFVTIATTGAGINTYSDTQVNGHSTIYYRVRATRTNGNSSSFSNVASVTTPNRAPALTDIPNQTIFTGTATVINVAATDADLDPISFQFTGLPAQVTFDSDDYGKGALTFPTTVPAGAYPITVQASDGSLSASDNFTVTVGNNHSPVIASTVPAAFSGTLTTEERRVTTLSYTISDPDGNNTLLNPQSSIMNMPAFGMSAWNNTSKTLTFTFSPQRGDAGLYTITVTFSDNQGGILVKDFNLVILPIDEFYTMSLNFASVASNYEAAPWNNTGLPAFYGSPITNLKDDSGNTLKFISVSTTLSTGGSQWDGFGAMTTDLPAPSNAVFTEKVRESFYRRSNGGTVTMRIRNLNPAVQYKVKLYGGFNETDGTVRNTRYIVTGVSSPQQLPDLNTVDNATEFRESNFMLPKWDPVAAEYVLEVTVGRGAGNTDGYYYINAMVLTAFYDNGNPPEAPSGLTLEAPQYNRVNVSWKDNSFNETGFDIFRAPSLNGTYTLIGSVNADDTSYVDPTTTGRTSYYYKVRAVNGFGTTITNAQLITTPNGIPVINALSTVVIQSGQTFQQNITATDPEGDPIAFTALNLPVFATLVDNGGGSGFIRFAPVASDIGSYAFTIQATDNFSGRSETGGSVVVQDSQYEEVVYLNFTGTGTSANAPTPWNNLPALANATALVNSSGTSSPIDLLVGAGWTTSSNDLGVSTGTNTGVYSDNILKSFWSTDVSDPSAGAVLTLSGLTNTRRYNITLLGSRNEFWFANTLYVINGVTKKLNTSKNRNNTIKFSGIQPSGGVITINIKRAASENANPLVEHRPAVLSAMIIEVSTPGTNPIKPSSLKAEGISKSAIRLAWVDNASDESGFEIYRAEEQGGAFSLINTTAANVESYTDTGRPQNKAYIYHIRAVKSGGASEMTPDVFASTFNQVILVNVNSSPPSGHLQASPPWNNLATPPSTGITFGNFRDDTNVLTSVGLNLLNWATGGTNNTGYITGNNSGIYPDAVVENYYYFEQSDPTIHLELTGLNTSYAYDLLFLGNEWSTIATIGGKIVATDFSVGTETVSQFNGKNPYETVSIKGVQPDVTNKIALDVKQNDEARYGVWNSLEIRSYTPLNTVFDQVPPTVPQGLAATDTTDVTVDLAWNASSDNIGIQGYEVFRGSTLVATVSTTTAQITGLQPSTTYTFSVRAYDVKGIRSGFSSSIQVTTLPSSTEPVLYYSKASGSLTTAATWGRNTNGTGTQPSNFLSNNQHFVLTRNVTLAEPWTIGGSNSKLILNPNIDLTLDATVTGTVDVSNNASLIINTDTPPQFGTLAPASTIIFRANAGSVPGANYGNIVLDGSNSTKIFGAGNYVVNGNLEIISNMTLEGAEDNNTVISLSGNLTLSGTATTGNRDHLLSLNFTSGAVQTISAAQSEINFYQIQVSDSTHLNTPAGISATTIRLGSSSGGGLIVSDGSVFNLGRNTLVIEENGAINTANETGRLRVSKADLLVNSTGTQVSNLYFVANSDTLNAMRLNASSSTNVNVRSKMYVRDIIDLTSGALNSFDNVVLVSDANGTARIGKIGNSGSLNGKVEFQRYLDVKGRIYRYLGAPVHATTVANWITYLPVVGPFTGSKNTNTTNSLFYYDNNNGGWVPYPSATSQEQIEIGRGYSIYIFNGTSANKLRITGPIQQGDFTFTNLSGDQIPGPEEDTNPGNGWNLLANPYASPIEWANSGWLSTGLNGTVYVRSNDATGGTTISSVKVWDGSIGSLPKGIIAQGQSFWVKAATDETPTLTVTEDAKYDTLRAAMQRVATPRNFMEITLSKGTLKDETYVRFTEHGTDGIDPDIDAFKLANSYFNLSTVGAQTNFAINNLPEVFCEKRIPVNIQNASAGTYTLRFRELTSFSYAIEAKLVDHFTGSETAIEEDKTYSFDITSDPASAGSSRFELVIAKPSLDNTVTFEAQTSGICGSGSIPVTLKNTQRGARYLVMRDDQVLEEVTGTGADIALNIGSASLNTSTTLQLKGSFEGCTATTLSSTITLEHIAKPGITVQNTTLVSSSASGNQWLLEGNPIPGATGATYKPAVSGEYTVVVAGASCEIASDPVLFAVTGLETASDNSVVLYPNPVKARYLIRLSSVPAGETVQIRVINAQGLTIGEYEKINRKEGIELTAAHLSAGLYTVILEAGQQQLEKRFIKE